MTDFDQVTPFSLVRGISVAGRFNPAIYLLICEAETARAVENDLLGEIRAQLEGSVHTETASKLVRQSPSPSQYPFIRLIYIDQWVPEIISSFDRYSSHLVQNGGQLLLLVSSPIAERLLRAAPNLRSRLTGIFQIEPEDLYRGGAA